MEDKMKKIGNFYFHGKRNQNKIALTFDDGPSKETLKILDILKRYSAHATFFVIAKRIKGREKIIERMLKEDHEIGNHTLSHKALWFKSRKFIEREILKADQEFRKFNYKTNLIRPPYGIMGLNFFKVCSKFKKKIIFLDVLSNDWMKLNVARMAKKILRKTKGGSIINMHDYLDNIGENPNIVKLVEEIVSQLVKKYNLTTVSEVIGNNKK